MPQQAVQPAPLSGGDDLQRIRAIDPDTERRLAGIGIKRFDDIARWTPADINRVNQALGLTGRIDREQWIEQAQILAKGGETYYSRNRAAAARGAAPQPQAAATPQAAPQTAGPASAKPVAQPTPSQPASPQPAAAAPTVQPQASAPPAKTAAEAAAAAAAAAIAATASAAKTAVAAAAPTPSPSPAAAQPAPAAKPVAAAAQTATPQATIPQATPPKPAVSAPYQGKSVAEMASAAAAAIAAASASVTRGIRPIEPISPMSRANPNISMPARLTDALKEKDAKPAPASTPAAAAPSKDAPAPAAPRTASPAAKADDLKRIRGVGVLIERQLNAKGVTSYAQIANWTNSEIDKISQDLDFKGRIERENWIEQARILSSGGHTEFSRRVDRGDVETSKDGSDA
ncbi:MAG: hypothetical protein HOP09_00880 [Hyphomicrobium sp.]|nr:hypothetical protein [Hyphomicrobium sp.]